MSYEPPAPEPSPGGGDLLVLRERVLAEVRKVVVGQEATRRRPAGGRERRRPRAARRRAGRGEDAARRRALARALGVDFRRVQFTPDMLPSDLTGTMTLRGRRARLPPRAGVRQRRAGRRDQPHAAEDPGGAARGDAGGPGHRRRRVAPAARPVPRGRHPEPDRVRGHLSAARGPARPLPRARSTSATPTRREELAMLRPRAPRRSRRPRSTTCSRSPAPAELRRRARATVDATGSPTRSSAYVVAVVRRTRELPSVALGASPRAAVHLLAAAKAAARLAGRDFVTPDDVGAVAPPVLRHRLRAAAGGRARALPARRRGRDRARAGARAPVTAVAPRAAPRAARRRRRWRSRACRCCRCRSRSRSPGGRRRARRRRSTGRARDAGRSSPGRLPDVVARGVAADLRVEVVVGRCREGTCPPAAAGRRGDRAGRGRRWPRRRARAHVVGAGTSCRRSWCAPRTARASAR